MGCCPWSNETERADYYKSLFESQLKICDRLEKEINELKHPTADVVEVRHGHWIKTGNKKKCSVCEFFYFSNKDDWNGCPMCLAKMDGKKGDG